MSKDSSLFHQKLLSGGLTVLILSLLISPLGYLIRSIYSHTLSIEEFGLFFAVLTFFNMVSAYSDLGFGATVSYLLPKYIKGKDYKTALKVYRYGQIIQVGTAILIAALILPFASTLSNNYFKVPGSERLIYIMCIYLISTSFLNSLIQTFIGLQKEKYYSSINLIRLFFTLTFSVLFILFKNPDIIFYAISWACGYSITAVIYIYLLNKNYNYITSQKISWDKKLFKSMYTYAFPTLIATSIGSVINFSDSFFLTLMKGVREVGIYNIVFPLATIPNLFISPLHNFVFPLISHLTEGERDKVKFLIDKVLILVPFLCLYFALFIIMFPSIIVSLIFGQKWVGLVELPLSILSIGFISTCLYTTLGIFIAGLGEVKKRVKITLFIVISSILLTGIFVHLYGVTGVVIANSLTSIISVYLFGRVVKSVINFNYPFIFYLKLLCLSVIIYTIFKSTNFYPDSWAILLLTGVAYTIIYFGGGFVLNVFDKEVIKLVIKKGKNN